MASPGGAVKFWQAATYLEVGEISAVARAADACGFHGLMVSDHVLYPQHLASRYPYSPTGEPAFTPDTPWPDPWVLIGALAAVTEHLQFSTNVYVAPARNVFVVAKAVATAAVLSGDRVALGLGAGWMREEFDLTGEDFATRGRRLDEMIVALRALWAGGFVEHHGEHIDFPPVRINPVPGRPVPIWCGGESGPAMRRATEQADGWIGTAYTPDDAVAIATRVRDGLARTGRAGVPFEIILGVLAWPDPVLYRRLEDAGVTGVLCVPWLMVEGGAGDGSTAAKCAAVERFAETVIATVS